MSMSLSLLLLIAALVHINESKIKIEKGITEEGRDKLIFSGAEIWNIQKGIEVTEYMVDKEGKLVIDAERGIQFFLRPEEGTKLSQLGWFVTRTDKDEYIDLLQAALPKEGEKRKPLSVHVTGLTVLANAGRLCYKTPRGYETPSGQPMGDYMFRIEPAAVDSGAALAGSGAAEAHDEYSNIYNDDEYDYYQHPQQRLVNYGFGEIGMVAIVPLIAFVFFVVVVVCLICSVITGIFGFVLGRESESNIPPKRAQISYEEEAV